MELDPSELYSTRMLIFLETEPQSNKYRQLLLNPEEFKKVSLSIGTAEGKSIDGLDLVKIKTSEDEYDLPDLSDIDYD